MISSKHGSVSTSEKSPEKKQSLNANDILSNVKVRVNNKLIIGNLNISSIAGKFDQLKLMVQYKVDIPVLTETKIDSSFLNQQFNIEGFCLLYRLDRNKHGGGVLVYIREDIPSKISKKTFLPDDIEGIFIELNLRKYKCLLCATYHPPNQKHDYFFNHLGKAIDVYYQTYEKFLLIGISMQKIQNHAYRNFCLSMIQKILFLKKHALKVKATLAALTFLLQTLLIVFKINQQ